MNNLRTLFWITVAITFSGSVGHALASDTDPSNIISVKLERTSCYGPCPVYSVTAMQDGTVSYFGRKYMKKLGQRAGRMTPAEFGFLVAAVERAQFSSFRERYFSVSDGCLTVPTDNPSIIITVQTKSGSKSVNYYMGCKGPSAARRIIRLADTIDELTDTTRLIDNAAKGL